MQSNEQLVRQYIRSTRFYRAGHSYHQVALSRRLRKRLRRRLRNGTIKQIPDGLPSQGSVVDLILR